MKYKVLLALIASLGFFGVLSAEHSYNQGYHKQVAAAPILYYSSDCPHCQEVMRYLSRNGQRVLKKDISNPHNRAELRELGQRKVPVLVVGSRVIVGSDRIIAYFESGSL